VTAAAVGAGLGPLASGDRVAVISPAGPTPADQARRASELLLDWGLVPVLYPSTSGRHARADYLSGADEQRARDLTDAWCDADVAGIFCLRGGYGTVRILDLLDADRMRIARPKPLYGSSDITALHEWLREQLGAASWFTPMIGTGSLLDDVAATAGLRSAVLEQRAGRRWTADAAEILVPGRASGRLIGGNLSLLAMTVGAVHRPRLDHRGAIVLLEDTHEETYRLDGYLVTLLRAGWFDGVAGVVLGSWSDCGPEQEIHDLCLELLGPLGVPMIARLGFGHVAGAPSIPLGCSALLVAEPPGPPELIVPDLPVDQGVCRA
jgi:muramoyltetrapeptide carboxypeptidase